MGSPIYRQEGIDGEFINTMLPRTRVEAGMSFKELLLQIRQTVADAVEHQNFPIDLLFRSAPGRKPNGRYLLVQHGCDAGKYS
ncbi:hypothetical protein P7H12_12825 [Paenibacillus larvae]|nr:hypothetical protein [Paenibacillus larvae]MDT2264297.1 hypothetical protein [Paenibacillus larvae]